MSYYKGFKTLATLGVDTSGAVAAYTNRKLNREPVNSFDGNMYDVIKVVLKKYPKVAKQVRKAVKDPRITKCFCDESKLYEQVDRFETGFTKSMQGMENYEAAWRILRSMLPKPTGQLRPIHLDENTDVSKIFSNPDASSGIIAYPKHKWEVADEIRKIALYIMGTYDKQFSLPAIALTRAQITDFINDKGMVDSSNINYKTRLVMCVDAASVLVEQTFGQPLLDNIFKGCNQYAGGKNDGEINSFLLEVCKGKKWISLDYSKFDASVQAWLIKDIFKFLAEYFPEEYGEAFDWISHNFIYMQILMPDGSIRNLKKGIKSGSYFTQIVGTLANIVMILTYLVDEFAIRVKKGVLDVTPVLNELRCLNNRNPRNYTIMAMGDDNIFFTFSDINVERMSRYLMKNFKAKITVDGEKGLDRGEAGDIPHFLKRNWTKFGQEREDIDMWINLLHPERRRTYDGYNPYHILYGYFLTFRRTMEKYFSQSDLVKGMESMDAGLEALSQIKLTDLPGSLRSQIIGRGVDRALLVDSLRSSTRR